MKILVIDAHGESALGWVMQCQSAGHDIRWAFSETERNKNIGKGLVKIVREYRDLERWPDLVFMPDNTKYVAEMDRWRERGVRVVGPNKPGADLELDRECGMKALKRAGIVVPPAKEFHDYDSAIRYVKREGTAFVSKPCGVEGDKGLTYVSKSAADMVFQLEKWKKRGTLHGSFVLQEKIKGTEFAVGGWFGPEGWNEGWEENIEHKKLMPGEIGPNTGEMGTVLWFTKRSKLARDVLLPLTDQLDRMGYIGCVDVNVIVDDLGHPWPLEFTCRPGWPAFHIQQPLMKGDPAEWLYELAEGRDARPFIYNRLAVGVVYGLPDLPYDRKPIDEVTGVPIYGIDEAMLPHLHPCQVMEAMAPVMIRDQVVTMPMWCSAGTYVMVVTGTGDSVQEARRECYGIIDKISMPASPLYRDDIGEKLKTSLPKLQKHGYALGINYAQNAAVSGKAA